MKHCINLLILFSVLLFISCSLFGGLDEETDYGVSSFNFKEGSRHEFSDPMWLNSGGDYLVPKNCTLRFVGESFIIMRNGSHLIIEEGAVIEMPDTLHSTSRISVGKLSVHTDSKLTVNGTAENPVTFRNINPASTIGWRGIHISDESDNSGHKIRHAIIDGAIIGIECEKENGLILENSIIKNSKKYGIKLKTNRASHIDSSLFQNNGVADIYSEGTNFSNISASNKFETGISLYSATEYDWVLPQCSYRIIDILTLRGSSIISEGTILRFTNDLSQSAYLRILEGSLHINGTAQSPVILKSLGFNGWAGLRIYGDLGDQNKYKSIVNYTIIDGAGWGSVELRSANLHLSNSEITNYNGLGGRIPAIRLDRFSIFINENNTGFDDTDISIEGR